MKIFCVLMPFAFVNVLALTETDYKKQVFITNFFFGALNPFGIAVDDVVETLICSNCSIKSMALMLVAPENADTDERNLEQLIHNERQIQNLIRLDYGIADPNVRGIDFNNTILSAMGTTRRRITNPSLKRLLLKVERESQTRFSPLDTCYLIALLKTGSDPRIRVKDVKLDEDEGDCQIIEIFDIVSTYIQFDDGFWRINTRNRNKIAKLTNEIMT